MHNAALLKVEFLISWIIQMYINKYLISTPDNGLRLMAGYVSPA